MGDSSNYQTCNRIKFYKYDIFIHQNSWTGKMSGKIKEDMYHNPEDTCHCFKFDVRHFYESIDHNILKYRYARLFKDEDLL